MAFAATASVLVAVIASGYLVVLADSPARSDFSGARLEKLLKQELRKRGLHPKRVKQCVQKPSGGSYVCRWRAKGLFPGEVPYKCSGKATFRVRDSHWKIQRCRNKLDPMVPLLPQPGPHPIWGYNDDWDLLTREATMLAVNGGAEVARMYLRWKRVEGSPGQYGWHSYDGLPQMAAAGLRPLLVLSHAPCWARPSGTCHPTEDIASPAPEHTADAAHFAALAAQRYPEALAIEVWNEPNLAQFWGAYPDPELYSRLVQEVAQAVHAVNPAMPVISAGLAPRRETDKKGMADETFLRRAYTAGGLQFADAIGAHPYPLRSYAQDYLGNIRVELYRYLRAMKKAGETDKPIWVTEVGVANAEGYTLDEQADALVKIYNLFRRIANVPVVINHRFIDRISTFGPDKEASYGVVTQYGEPKPAYCAMAAAREQPC
jgi:hypothetical protein